MAKRGRKPIARSKVHIHDATLELLKVLPGRTWNDKVKNLINYYIKNSK